MNIRNFATICGVSISTVSRALSRPFEQAEMSRELYDKIREKAAEVGYSPNYHAKVLHTQVSNNIGFIAGSPLPMNCGSAIEGISSVFSPLDKGLMAFPCNNDPRKEVEALASMIYRKMDAIIYFPHQYPSGQGNFQHLPDELKKTPHPPPVIAIMSGIDSPLFFQVRCREYAIGQRAARRHLAEGCRIFGILDAKITTLRNEEIIRGYTETLLENGVPPENIRPVNLSVPFVAEEFEMLRGVDALWACYLVGLPGCFEYLEKICRISELHIDTHTFTETVILLDVLLTSYFKRAQKKHPFKSLMVSQTSMFDLGVRTAKMTLKILKNKRLKPYTEYVENRYCSFDDEDFIQLPVK